MDEQGKDTLLPNFILLNMYRAKRLGFILFNVKFVFYYIYKIFYDIHISIFPYKEKYVQDIERGKKCDSIIIFRAFCWNRGII